MKKIAKIVICLISLILFLGIVVCLVGIAVPDVFEKFDDFNKKLPEYSDKVEYCDGGFGDFMEYREYYYTKDKITEFQNNSYFKKSSAENINDIKSYFHNFEQSLNFFEYKNKYNFNKLNIKTNDYFYIKTKTDNPYNNYDVYYVDTEKCIMYYIHLNI